MQQRCPNCGSPVIPGQRFCGGCGAQLSLSCPQCRITVSPGTRFCPNCGATFGGGPTQQPGYGPPGGMPPQQPGWGQQPGYGPPGGMPPQQPGWGQQQPWAPPAPKSQSSSSRPLLVMLLIILLIGLGGLIYWQRDSLLAFFKSSTGVTTNTTTIDTTKPVISSIVQPTSPDTLGPTSASILWHTDELSSSQVEYGTEITYGSVQPSTPADDPTGGTSLGVVTHSIVVTGLQPTTPYHYRVKSKDAAGNEAVSADNTFTTTTAAE
ncbi:MAG: zinc ribbon domain-containing protein [Dehalococcoidia bacterium]|nr:zinc ribbon domain-containing protein [Dehalococcoidia bacterium]